MRPPAPERLYHFTCFDAAVGIDRRGLLQPWPQKQWPGLPDLVWLTDLAIPDEVALGLVSVDFEPGHRIQVRYEVDSELGLWWPAWSVEARVPWFTRLQIEEGRSPDRWWIALEAIACRRSR